MPSLEEYEIRIKTLYTLISGGTELAVLSGERKELVKFPCHPGYCNVGVVEEIGEKVEEYREGNLVYSESGHAEFNVVNIRREVVESVPEGVEVKFVPLVSLAAVGLYGVRRANIKVGEPVAVIGLGLVGQFALQFALLSGGYPIMGIDKIKSRREKALNSGADKVFASLKEIKEKVPVILDCTGVGKILPQVLEMLEVGGRLVIVGSPYDEVKLHPFRDICRKDLQIIGTLQPNNPLNSTWTYRFGKKSERKLILSLMAAKKLKVEGLITHIFKKEEYKKAYELLKEKRGEVLGVLLDWR